MLFRVPGGELERICLKRTWVRLIFGELVRGTKKNSFWAKLSLLRKYGNEAFALKMNVVVTSAARSYRVRTTR